MSSSGNCGSDTLSGGNGADFLDGDNTDENNGPALDRNANSDTTAAPDGLVTVSLERTPVRARGKLLQIRHDCPLTKNGVGHLVLSSAKRAKTVTEMCRKRCLGLAV